MKKLLILCLLCISLCACSKDEQPTKESATYFDTVITLSVYGDNAGEAIQECFDECQKLEMIFSRTDKNSELYKVNHRKDNTVTVSDELAYLIQKGLEYYPISNEKFDISIAPLSDTWDFKSEEHVIPNKKTIQKALDKVNASHIHIQGNTITFDSKDTMIDLGAIVKGYAADTLKQILLDDGITNAIINLGGNVLTLGDKPDHSGYKVGIQKPFGKSGESLEVIEAKDLSIVSSGLYERYFKVENTIYHHILDSKTGYPINNGLYQVTILSPSSLDGDILSTVSFVLGKEKGMEYIESLDGIEAIFVDEDLQIYKTSGLQ